MPQSIDLESKETCELEECIDGIAENGFDPNCAESLCNAAMWLRKLTNNRVFLADLLINRLKRQGRNSALESGYGPQAIMLSPLHNEVFLRANIWPSERDLCFQTSGARNFVYGVPHDHNFSFLTSGYLGPGYRSDYYEYDYGAVAGFPGEDAGLRFIERSALDQGKIMLYRAHRDIHSQIPPESLSVSLNIMHVDPAQAWFDQYGFDLENGEVERVLSPNSTEAFLRVAVASGAEEALDFADWVGRGHPSDRLRLASFEARSAQCTCPSEQSDLWRQAEMSGSRMLQAIARDRRATLESVKEHLRPSDQLHPAK
ncbi:MAG: transposase [Pseudomonadota bacterium]